MHIEAAKSKTLRMCSENARASTTENFHTNIQELESNTIKYINLLFTGTYLQTQPKVLAKIHNTIKFLFKLCNIMAQIILPLTS